MIIKPEIETAPPRLELVSVFLKSASFTIRPEAGRASAGLPEIAAAAEFGYKQMKPGVYEAVLSLNIEATRDGQPLYVATVRQCGIVGVAGGDLADHVEPLTRQGPALFYPYAREAMVSLVDSSGFPRLNLGVSGHGGLPRTIPIKCGRMP